MCLRRSKSWLSSAKIFFFFPPSTQTQKNAYFGLCILWITAFTKSCSHFRCILTVGFFSRTLLSPHHQFQISLPSFSSTSIPSNTVPRPPVLDLVLSNQYQSTDSTLSCTGDLHRTVICIFPIE